MSPALINLACSRFELRQTVYHCGRLPCQGGKSWQCGLESEDPRWESASQGRPGPAGQGALWLAERRTATGDPGSPLTRSIFPRCHVMVTDEGGQPLVAPCPTPPVADLQNYDVQTLAKLLPGRTNPTNSAPGLLLLRCRSRWA